MDPREIVILGLGPGGLDQLTLQAWEILVSCNAIYARSGEHPVLKALPNQAEVISFDELLANDASNEVIVEQIAGKILHLGRSQQRVVYAVPGHPGFADLTAAEIMRRAKLEGLPVRIVEGISFLEPAITALGINPPSQLTVIDALQCSRQYAPLFPPHAPALITQLSSVKMAVKIKNILGILFPQDHPVSLVHSPGAGDEMIEELPLSRIDESHFLSGTTILFVPELGKGVSFEDFLDLVAHLRSPEGCPWDRQQTHLSLRATLLEETYEVLDALDSEDLPGLREELGDLLLQIFLHAQIAAEMGEFSTADVIHGIYSKLVRRHPHVFARQDVDGVAGVLLNWEAIKAKERAANGESEKGLLDGVVRDLPALTQADQFIKRSARVGFEWPDSPAMIEKLMDNFFTDHPSFSHNQKTDAIGDLLFSVVHQARRFSVDPESALRQINMRFKERFSTIESTARKEGKKISDYSQDEILFLWRESEKYI